MKTIIWKLIGAIWLLYEQNRWFLPPDEKYTFRQAWSLFGSLAESPEYLEMAPNRAFLEDASYV